MKALRYRPPNVLPLELWDVVIDGTPLYLLESAAQPRAISALVQRLQHGHARRLREQAKLPALRVTRVVLAGGGEICPVRAALQAHGFDAQLAEDPGFVAYAGGRALLEQLGAAETGAVVDVGQTAIKVCTQQQRLRVPRPLAQVPLELHARDERQPLYRANTVRFFAEALRSARPEALVLALPCEVDDALVVAGCSYPWLAGDTTLVRDVLRSADLADVPCLVLNDAELAALSVSTAHAHPPGTLVLTLGLGLGAAYLR